MRDVVQVVQDAIMKSPMAKKAISDARAAVVKNRAALVAEREQVEAEYATAAPALVKAVDDARDELRKARERVRVAQRAHAKAVAARHAAHALAERKIATINRTLVDGADPAIVEFAIHGLDRLQRETWAALRSEEHHRADGGTDYHSNRASVDTRIAAIRAARDRAMALTVSAVEDVPAALRAIVDELPPVGPMKKIGERPYLATGFSLVVTGDA